MRQILTVTLSPALDKTVGVDGFEIGGTNRIRSIRLDAGGKGINVAKALKSFDVEICAFGLQAGRTGEIIRQRLDALGLAHRFLEAEGETRTNLKLVDERSGVTTELNEPGFPVAPDLLARLVDEYRVALEDAAVVVLAGSLPPGSPEDIYRTLIGIAREKAVPVILDADGPALVHGVNARPYALKPNLAELERLTGKPLRTDGEILDAARALVRQGIRLVLVSMGEDGSLLVGPDRAFRARPFPIQPQSTVGAGDSMVAALAYGLMKQLPQEDIARMTSAAGTITATKPGTEVCTLDEILEKLPLIEVTPLL